MNINKLIQSILKPTGVPVNFQIYIGDEDTYITFHEYLNQGENYSDDLEEVTGHYMQIDLFSKGNLELLEKQVVKLLIQNNFIKRTINNDYEPDTQLFHKCCRFFFYEKNKEEN